MQPRGMSKSDLARAVDVTPGAVSSWTKGRGAIEPPLRTLRRICRALGTDLATFFEPFRGTKR